MKKLIYALMCAAIIFTTITPKQTSILDDVRAGDKQAIKQRLEGWQDCSQTDENGNNGLHVASQEGQAEIVEMLTTQSDLSGWWNYICSFFMSTAKLPDKDGKNRNGDTPLHIAMEQEHVETSEKLLTKGANPKITNKQDLSPVFNAIHENKRKIVPLLVKHQLIYQRSNGNTTLHFAIKYNLFDMVGDLAQNTNLALQENNQGKTATMVAAEQKDTTSLKILHAKGINLNARGKYGRQPIHSAALTGNYEGAKYLLENGAPVDANDDNEDTGLLLATSTGEIKLVDLFLAYKADVKKRNKQGQDILCVAVSKNRRNLIERLKQHPDVKIDGRDDAGRTAFMNATIAGNHSMMRILYETGANIHILDNKGENAIHKVAQTGDTNGLALLIPYHSSDQLDKKNHQGNSPIFVAIENGNCNIITQLLHAGVSLIGTNNNDETIFHKFAQCKNAKTLPALLSTIMNNPLSKPHISTQAHNGLSAMHYASANDNVGGMQELAKHGASYIDITANGNTLAHTAAAAGAVNSLQHLKYGMPMMLQQRNKHNYIPLITAAETGNLPAVKFLYHQKFVTSEDRDFANKVAYSNHHKHIVSFFTDHKNMCIKVANQPQEIRNIENQIKNLREEIRRKNYQLPVFLQSSLKEYSVNDLLHKTEDELSQVSIEQTKILNEVSQMKTTLEVQLGVILYQEEQQRQERIRQERERKEELQERLRKQQAEEQRVIAERAEQNRQEALKEQALTEKAARLDKYKKENEEKKAKEAFLAQQQALLDQHNTKKAQDDAAALEKQQPHVQVNVNPAHLLPSAPPMEPEILSAKSSSCACGKKLPAKPLPCVKCKKKIESACPQCVKSNKGRCTQCLQYHELGIEKSKGECFFGTVGCTEKEGVTPIPCDNCKKSSARNCPTCFELCHKKNIELNQPNRCPHCGEDKLNETLIKAVKAQK